jgi:hypothetical protein
MMPGGMSRVPEPTYVAEILPEHLPIGMLSIAVFGPGEGEAIVVRLPDGSVGVVDGCREPRSGSPDPVRELLAHIEHDPATPRPFALRFVCLTHPHDDHYAGLGRLLEAYQGRVERVWTVAHVTTRTAKALMAWIDQTRAGRDAVPDAGKLKGLERVIERIHAARTRHGARLRLLQAGVPVLGAEDVAPPVTITACGPADDDLMNAAIELDAALVALAGNERAASRYDPNLTSGALLVRWEAAAVLLAGDLLIGSRRYSGWGVAREHADCKVQVVNVAHHASEEAHDDPLWTTMQPTLAIVTPFKSATGAQPPRPGQIMTLARSAVVAITSPPAWSDVPGQPRGLRLPAVPIAAEHAERRILAARTAAARRNAVAVSLDAAGDITRFVLAGQADVYEPTIAGPAARSRA